jgi:ribosomal-protein-alanine N-acetyltransferase
MIQGEKVTIRTIRQSDLDPLFDLLSNIRNRGEYVPWDLPTQTGHQTQFNVDSFWGENQGTLLICVGDNIVGTISFMKADFLDALELGYTVFNPVNRNKGFCTEALSLFCKYLFATKRVNRLQVTIDPSNVSSRRVVEKCGFTNEGLMRGALFIHGKYRDMVLYSLLRDEADCFYEH